MAIARRWLRRICGGGAFATIATLAACSGGAAAPIDGAGATGDAATGADGSGTGDDAATHSDGASTTDATTPDGGDASTTGDGATQGCGAYASATLFTCTKDGGARVKCVGGATQLRSVRFGVLPGEPAARIADISASEVTIRSGALEDRSAQIKPIYYALH